MSLTALWSITNSSGNAAHLGSSTSSITTPSSSIPNVNWNQKAKISLLNASSKFLLITVYLRSLNWRYIWNENLKQALFTFKTTTRKVSFKDNLKASQQSNVWLRKRPLNSSMAKWLRAHKPLSDCQQRLSSAAQSQLNGHASKRATG